MAVISGTTAALIAIGTTAIAVASANTKEKPVQSSKPAARRTRNDYSGTSFGSYAKFNGPNMLPLQPLQLTQQLQAAGPMQPLQPLQPLKPMGWTTPKRHYVEPVYNYYNDPYQVNSLADVLLNREGKNLVMEDLGMEWATNIPVLQELIVGVDYLKRSYVDPFGRVGKDNYTLGNAFAEAGVNALVSTGETLDIIANPIKGLVIDGPQGFARGLGIGKEGRTQYDYNPDLGHWLPNIVVNMGAEIASDPINWITFGGKAFLKKGLKEMADNAMAKAAKEVGKEVTEQTARKFNKRFATEIVMESLKKAPEKSFKNSIRYLKNAGVDQELARAIYLNLSDEIAYYNAKNIIKSTYSIVKGAEAIDKALLAVTPMGTTFKITKATFNKIAKWTNTNTLNKLTKYTMPIRSFDGAEVLDPSTLDIGDILKSVEYEETINYIMGKRPIIEGLPSDKLLVTRFQEFEMYKENKTVVAFINNLELNGDITNEVATRMHKSVEFIKYYEDSIVAQGTALEALYSAIDNNNSIITAHLRNAMADQPNRIAQLVVANEAWSEQLRGLHDVSGFDLNNFNDLINGKIENITKQISEATDPTAISKLNGDLYYWNSLKDSFDTMLRDLDVTLEELPDTTTMQMILQSKDPAKTIDNLLNGYDFVKSQNAVDITHHEIGYLARLKENKIMYKETEAPVLQMRNTLLAEVNKAEAIIESHRINLRGKDLYAKVKRAEDLLSDPEYVTKMSDELNDALIRFADLGRDLHVFELNLGKRDADRLAAYIGAHMSDTAHELLPNIGLVPSLIREMRELKFDITETQELIDKLNKVRSLLDNENSLKSLKTKNITAKNIKKYTKTIQDSKLDLIAKPFKNVELDPILPGSAVHYIVEGRIKNLGLDNADIIEQIQDALVDVAGEVNGVPGAIIGNIFYTRDQLVLLNRIIERLDISNQKNMEDVIDLLYELGDIDFDTNSLRVAKLEMLDPSNKYYNYKYNDTYVLVQLMDKYETYPAFKRVINDLASETSTTPIGVLFNILEEVDTDSLIFNTSTVKHIKKDAKAQLNFTNLFNNIMSSRNNVGGIREAFLDLIAGRQYHSIERVMDELSEDGVTISVDKLAEALSYKINGLANSGILKNSNLHEYYGLGEVDKVLLHNAKNDVGVTTNVFLEQVRRGYVKLDDGEIFTVMDLETTGLKTDGTNQILQIYGHKYQKVGDDIVDLGDFQRVAKLNKGQTMSYDVARVLGEDLVAEVHKSRVLEDDAINDFLNFIKDSTLVGHNSDTFDIPFLQQRAGIELVNKTHDTLQLAKKGINFKDIDMNAVKKYAGLLTNYVQEQRKHATTFVKFVDKRTLDQMFDLARELTGTTASRFLNSKEIVRRMKGNILEDAITELIGKRLFDDFTSEFGKEAGQELVNATINHIEVPGGQSLIAEMRDLLTEIKDTNRLGRNYYISSKDINELAGHSTNIYAYMNSNLKTNGYVSNKYAPRRVYQSSYMRDIVEQSQKLSDNKEVREAFGRMVDANSDPITIWEASETIALKGSNEDQAARIFYANELVKRGATKKTNLNDVGNAVIAYGQDEIGNIATEIRRYSDILANTKRAETDVFARAFAINETRTILDSDPASLAAFMFDEAPRIRIGNKFNSNYSDLIDNILENKELYEAQGITIIEKNDTLYLDLKASYQEQLLDNSNKINRQYGFKTHRTSAADSPNVQKLLDAQDEMFEKSNRIRKNPLPFNAQSTAANNMYADNWRTLYRKTSEEVDFTDSLADNSDFMTDFFRTRDPKQTYINLGDMESRRMFDRYQQDPFRSVVTRLEKNISRVDGRNKFIELNFTKDLALGGPIFRNLSDQDILDLFNTKSKDYTVMVLVQDKSGKGIVRSFKPRSVEQIAKLKELGGVIAPQFYANKVIKTINKAPIEDILKNPIAQWYYKYITSTYKTIYLSTIGMLDRNFNDILVKNSVGADADTIPTGIMSVGKAMQDFIAYDNAVKEIIETSQKHTLDAEAIAEYFASGQAKISRSLFDEVHEYSVSNVSAGMASAQEELLKKFYIKKKASKFDKLFFDNKLRHYTVDQLSNINTYIEHAGRLSQLRMARYSGLDYIDAYNKVLRTHFDYGAKSKSMLVAELIIPFVTFPLYNLQYWLDAAFESPELVEVLLDATRTTLEVEAQKQFTLDNSNRLQSALLNGNVVFGGTLLKVNPSLYDAFNLVTDPMDSLNQRLSAPVKQGVDGLLKLSGQKKWFNPDPEPGDYVSDYVTNLGKLGLSDFEKGMSDWGLYPLTRAANTVLKGVTALDREMGTNLMPEDFEATDSVADMVPSLFSEYKQNYGARLGENYNVIKTTLNTGNRYTRVQSKTGTVVSSTFYPTKYPKVSTTAGRGYRRIPYTRRYYSGSYNFYNKWKANRAMPRTIANPASPEALQYAFKGLLYKFGMDPKLIRVYNAKQRTMYKNY